MPLATGFDLLEPALEGEYAVGAFNANNLESVKAVIDACADKEAPVFLQVSQGAIKYAGLEEATAMVSAAASKVNIPVALHLDHGTSYEQNVQCLRAGFTYFTPLTGLATSLGSRMEGIPVRDLIGGSSGFRRPGYVVSLEPGVSYAVKRFSFVLNVPVALYRNRTQSVTDIETEQSTGVPRHGDAAFADYLISAGVTCRFGGKMMTHEMPSMNMWEEVESNE